VQDCVTQGTDEFDPERPFKIGRVDERKARDSGPWLQQLLLQRIEGQELRTLWCDADLLLEQLELRVLFVLSESCLVNATIRRLSTAVQIASDRVVEEFRRRQVEPECAYSAKTCLSRGAAKSRKARTLIGRNRLPV
jgi:hypothetical protein